MVWKETMMYEIQDEKFICSFNSRLLERDFWLHFNDPRQIFVYIYQHFNSKFPRHFIFANFRCLRCGECCNDQRDVYREDIERWMIELRYDILAHVDCWSKNGWCITLSDLLEPCKDCRGGQIVTLSWSGRCPFIRKVRNKPYYKCRIHGTSPEECRGYLCEKSIPVANLNWINVEDLINRIGLKQYESLTKRRRK